MTDMTLHGFFRSGTSHRLRIALNLKGLDKYADRYELTTPPNVIAMHKMDLRLLLGLAYDVVR